MDRGLRSKGTGSRARAAASGIGGADQEARPFLFPSPAKKKNRTKRYMPFKETDDPLSFVSGCGFLRDPVRTGWEKLLGFL